MPQPENMQSGSIIRIYQDPITREQPEGEAVLKGRIGIAGQVSETSRLEIWRVKFLGETREVYRDILVTDIRRA